MHKLGRTRNLPANFNLSTKLPLTVGKAHFIRRVSQARQIMVLNLKWDLPSTETNQGVWATLQFTAQGAKLRIFDAAPDAKRRSCLAVYPFPLKEPVCQLDPQFQRLKFPFERPRKRFVLEGLPASLNEHPRPGAKCKLDAKGEAVLETLAKSKPPAGRKRWTLQLLSDRFVELKVVERISDETVRSVVKKNDLSQDFCTLKTDTPNSCSGVF